jgi:chaperonin cofactor prefoldin
LIAGRGKKESGQMRKRFEECELKVKTLRNKNNELQKQCDNDLMEGDIKNAIKAQTGFIEVCFRLERMRLNN